MIFARKHYLALVRDKEWTFMKVKAKYKLKDDALSSFDLNIEDIDHGHFAGGEKKKLKIALSCPGVITRIISLPKMPDKDLHRLLTEEVQQYFTVNTADYLIDYRFLGWTKENQQILQKVLLVAVPAYEWQGLWETCQKKGFTPKVVDLAADSLVRFYGDLIKGSLQAGSDRGDIAVLDLNVKRSELVLLEKGSFFLYSDLPDDLEEVKELLERRELCQEEEERKNLTAELDSLTGSLVNNVGDFFNFFSSRNYGNPMNALYITGELARFAYWSELFQETLHISTIREFPGSWVPRCSKRLSHKKEEWISYGSLFGLALRED